MPLEEAESSFSSLSVADLHSLFIMMTSDPRRCFDPGGKKEAAAEATNNNNNLGNIFHNNGSVLYY